MVSVCFFSISASFSFYCFWIESNLALVASSWSASRPILCVFTILSALTVFLDFTGLVGLEGLRSVFLTAFGLDLEDLFFYLILFKEARSFFKILSLAWFIFRTALFLDFMAKFLLEECIFFKAFFSIYSVALIYSFKSESLLVSFYFWVWAIFSKDFNFYFSSPNLVFSCVSLALRLALLTLIELAFFRALIWADEMVRFIILTALPTFTSLILFYLAAFNF